MNTNPEYIEREPDGAVTELMTWLPESTPDNALIELEAHTLRGVLAALEQARAQPLPHITDAEAYASATFDLTIDEVRSLKADRDAAIEHAAKAEASLIEVQQKADQLAEMLGWQQDARRTDQQIRNELHARAEAAEKELAELRERIGVERQQWGVQHPLFGAEYIQGSESARAVCRQRNAEGSGYRWRLVKRVVGEWKAVDDDGSGS